jgi:hypothetical protein
VAAVVAKAQQVELPIHQVLETAEWVHLFIRLGD